jgi:hypothetical protein
MDALSWSVGAVTAVSIVGHCLIANCMERMMNRP